MCKSAIWDIFFEFRGDANSRQEQQMMNYFSIYKQKTF